MSKTPRCRTRRVFNSEFKAKVTLAAAVPTQQEQAMVKLLLDNLKSNYGFLRQQED